MNLVRFFRRNARAVLLLTAMLMVGGVVALLRLPSNIYPELNFPRIIILVHSGDLSPQNMLLTVTRPLEEAGSTVLGVRRVRSKTIRGAAEVNLIFNPDMDMQYALQLVQARVGEARSSLPADTEIQVERMTPTVWPILSFVLNGNVPPADLNDFAFYVLRPLFSRVSGVSSVEVQASDTREVSVIVDPQKLLAHRIALPEIADRLKATNDITSVGRLDSHYLQYLVLASGQYQNFDQIRDTVIAVENQVPIRLRDIAEVRDGVEDRRILVTGNGQPAALISIARQLGGNIMQVANQVKQLAFNLGSAIPKTIRVSLVYDLAEFVHEAIGNVLEAILIGCLLAVVILFVFLREGRITVIAAITLPLTVIGTFFFLRLFGGTLNLMSMGGLAIAIGLIIDDAVVVVENIYRRLGLGESPEIAAERGTQELLGPVIGSTATTVVVFLPLGLLSGVVGEFFSALSLTLAASVVLSLIFAIALIPVLSEYFLSARSHRASSESFMGPVNRTYEKTVRFALGHRALVLFATALCIAGGVFLYTKLSTGFLPEMDEGGYVLDYITPPGTSLVETDRLVKLIEAKVAKMPETAAFSRRTGAELGLFATPQNTGDILVKLKPRSQRERGIEGTITDLRAQITRDIPGIDIEFIQILQDMIGDLEGNTEPIEVKIFGDNMQDLERMADDLGPKIEKIPGIVDYKGIQKGNPEIVVQVDPVRAGREGLTVSQVSDQLRVGVLGDVETELRKSDRTIPIRVRFPDSFRHDYTSVKQYPIVTPAKHIVPVSAMADIAQVQSENELRRENQRLMVSLTARLENRDLGSAVRDVRQLMESTQLPLGATWEIGGQYESQQTAFHELLMVLALALAAVFTVLVVQFRAFRPSMIIISAAPLSMLGVFGMLLVTGTALNVSSFMGIILMVGLVVKNGIILFQYVHRLWEEEGMPLREALVQAGRIRIRPILMTTLCTLFGLMPLALGLGSGAELQKPLALAVIGGLLLSTFITLLLMPVLYSLMARER